VLRRFDNWPAVVLVAGRHRLAAVKKIKRKTIPAMVEDEDGPAVERWAKRMAISENLVRGELTPAERAMLTDQRKAVYVAMHPETTSSTPHGGGRRRKNGAGRAVPFRPFAWKSI
jgi:ParB-like chromosome segregation protein Spo0J